MPNQEHTLYPAKNKSQPPKRRITIIIILLMVVAGMAVLWADNIFTPTNTATVVQNTTNTIADKSYNSQDTGILAPIINLFTTTVNKPDNHFRYKRGNTRDQAMWIIYRGRVI